MFNFFRKIFVSENSSGIKFFHRPTNIKSLSLFLYTFIFAYIHICVCTWYVCISPYTYVCVHMCIYISVYMEVCV